MDKGLVNFKLIMGFDIKINKSNPQVLNFKKLLGRVLFSAIK